MQTTPASLDAYLKSLKILHLAFLAGQVMFAAIAAVLVFTNLFTPVTTEVAILRFIVPGIAIACIVVSQLIFTSRLAAAQVAAEPEEKLNIYRTALILKFALIEGPCLLSTIAFLLSGNYLFLAISGLVIAWFAAQHPVRSKALAGMGLDEIGIMEWEQENPDMGE